MNVEIHLIKGNEYQFGKIDAITQFHVVRRLAPLVGELLPIFSKEKFKSGVKEGLSVEENLEDLKPLLNVFSKLPDADLEYCIFALCKKVYKKSGAGWAPIVNSSNGFQFDEIREDLALTLQITAKSLGMNLSGFINALPTSLNVGAPQVVK